jgi:conjugative transposon TraN protein
MKSKCVFASVVLMLLINLKGHAQNNNYAFIPSAQLTITYNKTTNLIFPYSVQSIDRGSKDILVQQPKGTENIVQVKADKPNFNQTNLSVITIDGKLYSFTVDYAAQPTQLNIIIQNKNGNLTDSIFKQTVLLTSANNEALFQAVSEKISTTKAKHGKRDKNNQMEIQLNGIYINHDMLYFRLRLKNNSNVSYDVDDIKFTIKDKQKSKRTATQEMELKPVYKYGSFENIHADSSTSAIIALPKFTLPDSKYLYIQVLEKNGGRNLNLVLKNKQIMKAIAIKEL